MFDNSEEVKKWFAVDGDNTLRLEYPLDDTSVVFDVGAYKGEWGHKIHRRYNCYVYMFEPLKEESAALSLKYRHNPKIKVIDKGISDTTKEADFFFRESKDSSSANEYEEGVSTKTTLSFIGIDDIIEESGIESIDLLKLNIEGEEFDVLSKMIESGSILKVNNLQVQFHNFMPHSEEKRAVIRSELEKNFRLTYDYPFVWENWSIV